MARPVTAEVRYLNPEPNGLAAMLGGLIEANLKAHPDRESLLRGRPATYSIEAEDAGVAVSIRLQPGRVAIRNGEVKGALVRVRADSDMLLRLSTVPLRLGLPDPATPEGRTVTAALLRGRLRVRGVLTHAAALARLNRLLAI